ncbi:hypothetical protein BN949_05695 [Agrobacterium tumefaciens]|nr:hypothetical protein BN949_05695 [Agrobacterium tumefaciens]
MSAHLNCIYVGVPVAVIEICNPQLTPFFMCSQKSKVLDLSEFFDQIVENSVPSASNVISWSSTIQVSIINSCELASFDHSVVCCFHKRGFCQIGGAIGDHPLNDC